MAKANPSGDRTARGANVRVPPPLWFAAMILLGGLAQRFLGGSLPLGRPIALLVGGVLITVAIGLVLWAGGLFRKTGQDVRPWKDTPELIVDGIYRYTRNPMYLAMALVQTGLGVGSRSPWLLLLVPVSMVGVYLLAIRPEEEYLQHKFGQPYRDYLQRVRRWI